MLSDADVLSTSTGPPLVRPRYIFPPPLNAAHCPSGEHAGLKARGMPDSCCGWVPSLLMRHTFCVVAPLRNGHTKTIEPSLGHTSGIVGGVSSDTNTDRSRPSALRTTS